MAKKRNERQLEAEYKNKGCSNSEVKKMTKMILNKKIIAGGSLDDAVKNFKAVFSSSRGKDILSKKYDYKVPLNSRDMYDIHRIQAGRFLDELVLEVK